VWDFFFASHAKKTLFGDEKREKGFADLEML
jgi:hypothetical protein